MKTNAGYTHEQYNAMGEALDAISLRAIRGRAYGQDMVSSRAAVLEDIISLAQKAMGEGNRNKKVSNPEGFRI